MELVGKSRGLLESRSCFFTIIFPNPVLWLGKNATPDLHQNLKHEKALKSMLIIYKEYKIV